MQLSTLTTNTTQQFLGRTRPRLYTRDEVAEELDVGAGVINRLIADFGIKPVFSARPYKFSLDAFKKALNEKNDTELYKIEKGIPVLPKGGSLQTFAEKQLNSMIAGDSLLIPLDQYSKFYTTARKLGILILCRKTECKKYHRLWRIK